MPRIKKVTPPWEEIKTNNKELSGQTVEIKIKKTMSKKIIVGLIILLIILIAVVVWVGSMFMKKDEATPSAYSVVEMSNGTTYFGKLSWFPSARLSNAWVLQQGVDARNQPQVGLVPANRAFWSPVDDLYLNEKMMMSWTYLRADSQLVKAFENPESIQQTAPQGAQAPAPADDNQ